MPPQKPGPWDVVSTSPVQAPTESTGGAMLRGAGQGASDLFGGLASLPHAIAHPIDTINAMSDQQSALGDRAVQDFKTGHYGNALWHGVDAAIPVLGPMDAQLTDQYQGGDRAAAMTRGAVNLAPALLDPAMKLGGAKAMEAGPAIIDNTVGALKKDFARGKSPGTGFFQARMGPTASMKSLANKATEANEGFGATLGSVYDKAQSAGVKVPAENFFDAINTPADSLRQSLTGPGGTGSTAALDAYTDTFKPVFDQAAQQGGIGPRDIFDTKRNVAKNTSWGDPNMQNMNSMRQQTVGQLSGVLGDALPETRPLNSAFANTMSLADRARMRADTGSFPLTRTAIRGALGAGGASLGGHVAGGLGAAGGALGAALLDSVPARTSLASGLFYGGEALQNPVLRKGATASLFALPKNQSSGSAR